MAQVRTAISLVVIILFSAVVSWPLQGQTVTIQQDWSRHFPLVDSSDEAVSAATIDRHGNIYVVGSSKAPGEMWTRFMTAKFSPDGERLWTVFQDGAGNGNDFARDVAVDTSGNVFVTGATWGVGSALDYTTVKYTALGDEEWIARYDGPASFQDSSVALAIDREGNVLVTGTSFGGGVFDDIATLKYGPDGTELWVRRYDGDLSGNDLARDVLVDQAMNVTVVGTTADLLTPQGETITACLIFQYSPSGDSLWSWSVHSNIGGVRSVEARQCEVDRSGNIYVLSQSGYSTVLSSYTGSGVPRWDNENSVSPVYLASGMDIDSSGNVTVAVWYYSVVAEEWIVLVRRNSDGILLWDKYDGASDYSRDRVFVRTDDMGNVFFVGQSMIHQYDVSGNRGWTVPIPAGLEIRWVGRLEDSRFVGAGTEIQAGTTPPAGPRRTAGIQKYSTSGTVTRLAPPPAGLRYTPIDLAVDPSGNAVVTGHSRDSSGRTDLLTASFDPQGRTRWVRHYAGTGDSTELAVALATHSDGSVFVTGVSVGIGTLQDYLTIKYDSSGNELWRSRYNGPASGHDQPSDIVVDATGRAYVTGRSYDANGQYSIATLKYSAIGQLQWVARLDAPGGGNAYPGGGPVVDSAGNVYVAGAIDSMGADHDIFLVKYSFSGQRLWTFRYDGGWHKFDEARAIVLDRGGNILLTGSSFDSSDQQADIVTMKIAPDGAPIWVDRYDNSASTNDVATGIGVDGAGNAVVTAYASPMGTKEDIVTIRLDPQGNREWVSVFDGPASQSDFSRGIVVGDAGESYVFGNTWETSVGPAHGVMLRYDRQGAVEWQHIHITAGVEGTDYIQRVIADPTRVTALGGVAPKGGQWLWSLSAFTQTLPLSVPGHLMVGPAEYELLPNYPNPFNARTRISYRLPERTHVSLTIYDLLGRTVTTLVNSVQSRGSYEVGWDAPAAASGVYFCRLMAGTYNAVMKLMLTK